MRHLPANFPKGKELFVFARINSGRGGRIKYSQNIASQLHAKTTPQSQPISDEHRTIYHWITQGGEGVGSEPHPVPALQQIWAMERAKRATSGALAKVARASDWSTQRAENLRRRTRRARSADPSDAGMLDVVGFDTSTPGLMAEFVRGQI